MSNNYKYEIYTIKVSKLLKFVKQSENGLPYFALNSKETESVIRKSNNKSGQLKNDEKDDCAAFQQILKVCKISNNKSSTILLDKLVYLDFSEINSNSDNADLYKAIFVDGFSLTLNDKVVKFHRFEKSGGMSKSSVLSFIDETIYDEVEERITLGLDKILRNNTDKSVIISKYYAYKGLSMSSGTKINSDSNNFVLNNDSVVVIKDFTTGVGKKNNGKKTTKVFTAKRHEKSNSTSTELTDGTEEIEYDFYEDNNFEFTNIDFFDGEGLISFEYAEYISKVLGKDSCCFQIRLPMTKGMLFKCNFKQFFKERGVQSIIDCVGGEHDIEKVEIILTESQFKALKWFKEALKGTNTNVFEYYWEKIAQYEHSLYITNVDKKSTGITRLNYQVLHTLKIGAEPFDELCNYLLTEYKKITTDERAAYIALVASDIKDDNDFSNEEIIDDTDEDQSDMMMSDFNTRRKLLLKSEKFVKFCKSQRNNMYLSKLTEFGRGRFEVMGDNYFLSGDLLFLLYYIVCNCSDSKNYNVVSNQTIKALRYDDKQCRAHSELFSNYFYAPSGSYKRDNNYALFRNPHISRNEHVVLKAMIPDKNSVRSKYLGHLNGVVMVNCFSLVPQRLGGADFDGDMVKVIKDSIYSTCATDTCIDKNDTHAFDLPLINIPTETATPKSLNVENEFKTIQTTFSSKIGQICNIAFSNAVVAYNELSDEKERIERSEYVKQLDIFGGLDIDSAKNGCKPKIPYQQYKFGSNSNSDKSGVNSENDKHKYYLNFKDNTRDYIVGKKDVNFIDKYDVNNKKSVVRPNKEMANINKLPYYTLSQIKDDEIKSNEKVSSFVFNKKGYDSKLSSLFDFSESDMAVTSNQQQFIDNLREKYNEITKTISFILYETQYEETIFNRINFILFLQGRESYKDNINHAIIAIANGLETTNIRVQDLIDELKCKYWIYTADKNERISILKSALDKLNRDDKELDMIADIVCEFSNYGYELLADILTLASWQCKEKNDIENSESNKYNDADKESVFYRLYSVCNFEVNKHRSAPKAKIKNEIHSDIVEECKKMIQEKFNGNFSQALFCACQKNDIDSFILSVFSNQAIRLAKESENIPSIAKKNEGNYLFLYQNYNMPEVYNKDGSVHHD